MNHWLSTNFQSRISLVFTTSKTNSSNSLSCLTTIGDTLSLVKEKSICEVSTWALTLGIKGGLIFFCKRATKSILEKNGCFLISSRFASLFFGSFSRSFGEWLEILWITYFREKRLSTFSQLLWKLEILSCYLHYHALNILWIEWWQSCVSPLMKQITCQHLIDKASKCPADRCQRFLCRSRQCKFWSLYCDIDASVYVPMYSISTSALDRNGATSIFM